MSHYCVSIDLTGRKGVVVGGGTVAERKVETLLDFGAAVVVVAPNLSAGLRERAEQG